MRSLIGLFEKLRLKVNESKSAVDRVWNRPFLGFKFWVNRQRKIVVTVSKDSIERMRGRVREITRRNRGRSMDTVIRELRVFLNGWRNYFKLAKTPSVFQRLDEWIRHRLRAYQLKQWKRGPTVFRRLRALGASKDVAAQAASNVARWWYSSGKAINLALSISHFDDLGLPRLNV